MKKYKVKYIVEGYHEEIVEYNNDVTEEEIVEELGGDNYPDCAYHHIQLQLIESDEEEEEIDEDDEGDEDF